MRAATLVVAMLFVPTLVKPAGAEFVYLKSGGVLEGRVLEQSDDAIRLRVDAGNATSVLSIPRDEVLGILVRDAFETRLQRAEALLGTNQGAEAEAQFRELLRFEPTHAMARFGLARALITQHKAREALALLEAYFELVSDGRDARLVLFTAERYLEARDFRNARRVARDAAGLPSATEEIRQAADELIRRVERVRSGAEQLQERTAAEQGERARLRAERAEWPNEHGNSREAVEAGLMLAEWTADAQPRLLLGRHVEITAPADALAAYHAGGAASELQARVSRCNVKLKVDETLWVSLYDHQKAVFIYGWFYQVNERYPRCSPTITVVVDAEERGRVTEKRVARGTWDGRRESITIDRWTRENRDPNRPIRPVIR